MTCSDIRTSLVGPHPDGTSGAPKAKIQIWIEKTEFFDEIVPLYGFHVRNGHPGHMFRGRLEPKPAEVQAEEVSNDGDAGNTINCIVPNNVDHSHPNGNLDDHDDDHCDSEFDDETDEEDHLARLGPSA